MVSKQHTKSNVARTGNSATIRELECSRRSDVGIQTVSYGTRLPDRSGVHHPCTSPRVVAVATIFSICSRHTFDTDTNDSTRLGCRKSASRAGCVQRLWVVTQGSSDEFGSRISIVVSRPTSLYTHTFVLNMLSTR